jgi:hypothetical protein
MSVKRLVMRLAIIVVVLALGVGAYLLFRPPPENPPGVFTHVGQTTTPTP